MKPPFAGGLLGLRVRAVEPHENDLVWGHRFVGNAGRCDEKAVAVADADIARGTLVDAERVHPPTSVDDGLPFLGFVPGHRAGPYCERGREPPADGGP